MQTAEAARGTAAAAVAAARLAGPAVPPKLRPVPNALSAPPRPEPERANAAVPGERPTAAMAAAAAGAGVADLPRFAFPVANGLKTQRGGEAALLTGLTPEVNGILREAFTPTRPKKQLNSLFVGRNATLKRIISAVEEERAHVILFGDRGRGKTSLSNAIEHIAAQAGYLAIKLTCSGELSFEEIFRHVLKRIPSTYYRSGSDSPFASRRTFNSFAELLPEGSFSVTQLNEVLENIQNTHVLLILDEYDRVTDEDFRNKLAELFKNLTDSSIPMTLMVVGVAENLDQLLGKHPSIQRSLVPVHLPLMTDKEIERLIQAGAENAGLTFLPETLRRIVDFARGLPYYAQLLGLHAARSAFSRGVREVEHADLAYAVNRCLQEAERGIVDSYNRGLAGGRRETLEDALHAAALCPADEYGVFDPADIAGGDGAPPADVEARLERLTRDDHGALLVALPEPGRTRYRFRNQMARQYVLMRLAVERSQV
ncbi:nSTAND1 domain-containing NTPase [Azospirillum sp. ST 5-10]|uniref:nSTAND1 domain-containing NTPase n=1 Tax=unclassified Azospirillum TaxID=2630922 RepID=UPI003F4A279F